MAEKEGYVDVHYSGADGAVNYDVGREREDAAKGRDARMKKGETYSVPSALAARLVSGSLDFSYASEEDEAEAEAEVHDATDGAVSLAHEAGVDLADVEGSGSKGRVTKGDVQEYLDKLDSESVSGGGDS